MGSKDGEKEGCQDFFGARVWLIPGCYSHCHILHFSESKSLFMKKGDAFKPIGEAIQRS
jgi:hypothetical protein